MTSTIIAKAVTNPRMGESTMNTKVISSLPNMMTANPAFVTPAPMRPPIRA